MFDHIPLQQILFLDIETVCQYQSYDDMPDSLKPLWNNRSKSVDGDLQPDETYGKAALFAEFGKIICISLGYIFRAGDKQSFRTLSFYGDDEGKILTDFANLLAGRFSHSDFYLCAHNGKNFDFPYLCRRMLINGVKIPTLLAIAGKKPWEICHIDTLEIWKFGEWKSFASLNLLASVFGIPTPKDDIVGSQVNETYWQGKDLARIEKYCRKDVLTVAQLFLRFKGEPLICEEDVVVVQTTKMVFG